MPNADISSENSRKLDRVLLLLQGDNGNGGLEAKVKEHDELLNGKDGKLGIVGKVAVMWRIHIWILCAASGALGFIIRGIVNWKP